MPVVTDIDIQLQLDVPVGRHAGGYDAKYASECEYRIWQDIAGPASDALEEDAFITALKDAGRQFETRIIDQMVNLPGVVVITETLSPLGERTPTGKADVEQATFDALLDPAITTIVGGRIGFDFERLLYERRGVTRPDRQPFNASQPDVLLKSATVDAGTGLPVHLVPCDIKNHKALSGASPKNVNAATSEFSTPFDIVITGEQTGAVRLPDMLQLASYYRHLESLDLADDTTRCAIIGRDEKYTWTYLNVQRFFTTIAEEREKLSALGAYDHYDHRWQRVVENATASVCDSTVEPIVGPERKPACGTCQWNAVCTDELTMYGDGGHITLIAGITPLKAQPHYAAGVSSIRDLARLDVGTAVAVDAGATRGEVAGRDSATARYVGSGVKDLAKSVRAARVYSAGRIARNVAVNTVDLHRADVEVDFDLENSNGSATDVADDTQLVYLWGTRTTNRRITRKGDVRVSTKNRQFSDFSDTLAGERVAFAQFWEFLTTSRTQALAEGKTWRAFHYTRHELTWWRKLAQRHEGGDGIPTEADIDALIDTGDIVDLHAVLTDQLVWPTSNHSIKTLAKWARFSWRATDAGGDASLIWYGQAVTAPTKRERDMYRTRVLEYNIDDVAAQIHLRDWVEQLQAAEEPGARIPSVTSLRGPARRRQHQR